MMLRTGLIFVAATLFLALSPLLAQATGMTGWGHGSGRTDRTLSFYNTHTHERLETTYWRNGRYDPAALEAVNKFMRDHRNGHVHTISPELLNLLSGLKSELERRHPHKEITFHVISGYRSAQTNDMLRARGGGQAKKSRHVQGDAMDIRVPGIESSEIRDIAWCMQRGGVGYYRGSDFVHVDTSRVRYWNWKPANGLCANRSSS